jgi:hypothetical protein
MAKNDIMYIVRLLNTELINVSLPLMDICFPFELLSHFSKRSATIFPSELLRFL